MSRRDPPNVRTTRNGRFYVDPEGKPHWSVTTLLRGIPKPALMYWSAKMAAEYAVDHLDALRSTRGLKADGWPGRDAAIDQVKRAPWRERDRAADIGGDVHDAIEAAILDKPFPEPSKDAAPFIEQFRAFQDAFSPRWLAAELVVYNRTQKYAGRCDGIVQFEGAFWPGIGRHEGPLTCVLDVKTGKGIWPDNAIQMAGYRHAEFYEGPDLQLRPMPTLAGGVVLHLRPEKYEVIPVRTDEEMFNVLLFAREMFRFENEISKDAAHPVIGAPLLPPGVEPTGQLTQGDLRI